MRGERRGAERAAGKLSEPDKSLFHSTMGLIKSENEVASSDVMAGPRTNTSTANRIRRRVQESNPDTVFRAGQCLDLDTRTTVDKALSRLVASGVLRRLARGLYYQPRQHPVLGEMLPPVEAVARALADRDHVRLQPFGGYAANLLRLSDQVPARVAFLTDGKPREVLYGPQVIELRRASLRYVGKANVTSERVAHLRTLMSPEDRRQLIEDIPLAPAWMHPCFRAIAAEEEPS